MIKKLLLAAVVLVVLLVVAIVLAVMFIDVNRFKPQIETYVHDQYRRTLKIDGDVKLGVFPKIALKLPKTTLSEPDRPEQNFATIGDASVGVALMPLLSGSVAADKVTLSGVQATIEKRADGTMNIDDLIGAKGAKPDPAKPGEQQPAPPSKPMNLDINGIELKDSALTYIDRAAGSTTKIGNLNLEAGRIANKGQTPVKLRFDFSGDKPKMSGELSAQTTAVYDLDAKAFGAEKLEAVLKQFSMDATSVEQARVRAGRIAFDSSKTALGIDGVEADAKGRLNGGSDAFEATLKAPSLKIDEASAAGDTVNATLKLNGAQKVDARVDLSGVSGKADALNIAKLALDATLEQGARKVKTVLATPVQGNLKAGTWSLPKLAGSIDIDDPAIPNRKAQIALDGKVDADTKKQTVNVDFKANAQQDINLIAKAGVANFSKPRISFDVAADQLNIDKYFPPPPQQTNQPAPKPTTPEGQPKDVPIDLSPLKNLDLDGKLRVGRLVARNIKAQDLSLAAKAKDGRLDVAPISANLYQGRLDARVDAHAQSNAINVKADLTNINIDPLLQDAANKDLLEGRGNVNIQVGGAAKTVESFKRALNGRASLNLRDGAVKGINLGKKLREAQNLFQSAQGGEQKTEGAQMNEKTDFTEMKVSFNVANGIASSNDLDMKSPLLRIGGQGRVDIPQSALDYTVNASVVGTATGQGGKELDNLRGVTIPVRLHGPFAQMAWTIDWKAVAEAALKAKAGAQVEKLKEDAQKRLQDELKKRGQEGLDKQLGDSLKGLFNR